jgi:hypothetical protein
MSSEIQVPSSDTDSDVRSDVLADPRQRRVISILLAQSGPITERDLATRLAAREVETSPAGVTGEDRQRVGWDLYHRCLPMLEAAGWIVRYPVGIVASEHLSAETLGVSLADFDDIDSSSWESLAVLFARPRRQQVAAVLAGRHRPLSLDELGAELTTADASSTPDGDGNELTLRVMLHHIHLPALAEVGLVEYDSAERTVTPRRKLTALVDRFDIGCPECEATEPDS